MKFAYKKYARGILRPVIPIEIQHADRSIKYEVLVDSGADMCIFDAEIGELLGLKVTSGKPEAIGGITGYAQTYFIHKITLVVGGHPALVEIGFLPGIAPLGYGVVGQQGFFDQYIVTFDLEKEVVELKERGTRI